MKDRIKLTHQEKAELFETYIVSLAREYVNNKIGDIPTQHVKDAALNRILISTYGDTIIDLLYDI